MFPLDLGNALRSMGYLVGTLEVRELCKELQKRNKNTSFSHFYI